MGLHIHRYFSSTLDESILDCVINSSFVNISGVAMGRVGGRQSPGAPECRGLRVPGKNVMGCELHKNVFGGPAPPGPAGGAKTL